MNKMRQRKAFTIVEMVIVIAVIAILATVLIPTISGVIKKAHISADTQFAASLNIQLAMWEVDNGVIDSEDDLRAAINEFYGEDFYENLTPKSGKHGYHYWYDPAGKQVVLSTYEELADKLADAEMLAEDYATLLADGEEKKPSFSAASPRSLMVEGKNAFLMDQAGSEVATMLKELDNMAGPTDYKDRIDDLKALVEDSDESLLAGALQIKIEQTAIVTERGVFRYVEVSDVQYVYIASTVEKLGRVKVFQYDPTTGESDEGSDAPVATRTDIQIQLPANVDVLIGGFTGIQFSEDPTPNKDNTPELHVNATEDQLKDLFEASATNCVIVLPNGARYIIEGNQILRLPSMEPIGESLTVESIKDIEIGYVDEVDDANSLDNKDTDYFYSDVENDNKTLYLALDHGTAQLKFSKGVTASMVDWTVDPTAPIEISADGVITVKESFLQNPDKQNHTATITATLKADTTKTDSVTVILVFPSAITWNHTALGTLASGNITMDYVEATEFNLALDGVSYTFGGDFYVQMKEALDISFETSGTLFTLGTGNKLTLNPDALSTTTSQTLTVKYGKYVTEEYTITVTDKSAAPFKIKEITSGVKMGETYLFRVGNSNPFKLSALFSNSKPAKEIKLKIYDASKTTINGTRGEIDTAANNNNSNFWAEYTSNLTDGTWADKTIQFHGTGVAIIEIEGSQALAVEVVNGRNVYTASDWWLSDNVVLLNNITWERTSDAQMVGYTIYGNGFAIKAENYKPAVNGNTAMFKLSGCTIDNLIINGPVYPELSYSGDKYYIAGIYATGDVKILNSYISGFREPIMANGTSLYLENTTLVGGNYANLWLQTGTLTLKDVTTVQVSGSDGLGLGIVAGGTSYITIIGELNQYNWVTQNDANNMDSNIKSVVNQIFDKSELVHTVNGTKYVNQGILFQGAGGTVNNATQTNKDKYEAVNVSASLMGVSFEGMVYTHSSSSAITTVPTYGVYKPETQAVLKPTFKHNLTLTNGVVSKAIDIPAGEKWTLNLSGYSVFKYTGQDVTVNITCTGGTMNGEEITFSQTGTYTVTYTVEDNTFYNADGSKKTENNIDTYTVTVVVSNSNHPNAEIDLSGLTYKAGWSVSNLNGGNGSNDYSDCYSVLEGLKVYDYDENGNRFEVTITADNLNGLTVVVNSTAPDLNEIDYVIIENGEYWLVDNKADNNKGNPSVGFTYTYTGLNGQPVTKTSDKFTLTANDTRKGPNCVISSGGDGCVTPDTLVTLADGSKVRVDALTGEEMLLVWNMETGKLDYAPIMFVDSEGVAEQEVIHLYFSDGTDVKVIYEHGFWDYDLNKYVYLDANASDYIGHWFAKQNGDKLEKVQLVDVVLETEETAPWSPVTAGHLCYFVNDMLSMPGGVGGLFNIFEVDAETMTYDYEAMARDIETYGLFTYEELNAIVPLSEEMFNLAGGAYLKISIGKGNLTMDELIAMIQRYSVYFN